MLRSHQVEPPSAEFAAARSEVIELDRPLPTIERTSEDGTVHDLSLCLVRLHRRPLGLLELDLRGGSISPERLAEQLERDLGEEIRRHLVGDGLSTPALSAAGLEGPAEPACRALLEAARRDPPGVSVVIITRGRPTRVERTVRHILACEYPPGRLEIVIVHTPEHGEGAEAARQLGALSSEVPVRVVTELRPGVSRGRNTGLEAARNEIVLFADDDVDVDPEWLLNSMSGFLAADDVGATSGMTLPLGLRTPSQRWFEGFGGLQRGFDRRIYRLSQLPADQPLFPFSVGEFGSGRSMAFRRRLLSELGGFDADLGPDTPTVAGEDVEALLRVILAGQALVHEPAAVVWHDHPDNYALLRRRMWGYGVGLTACITRAVVNHPSLVALLARKLPRGVIFALSPRSAKNAKRQADYPRELIRLELLGMAYGPAAYLASRWGRRRRQRIAARALAQAAPEEA